MKTMTLRTARYSFISFLSALTVFTVVESAVGAKGTDALPAEGLSSCGTEAAPCRLETVAVTVDAPPAPALQLAEGLSTCGTEAEPCKMDAVEVTATPASTHLASAQRAMGMTLRVKS